MGRKLPLLIIVLFFAETPVWADPSWTCSQIVQDTDFKGGYWQWIDEAGQGTEVRVQISSTSGPTYNWSYSNRFTKSDVVKAYFGSALKPFEAAFQYGPEYVSGLTFVFDKPAKGALTAYYYGDSVYVGSEIMVSRRDNRRHFQGKSAGLGAGISGTMATKLLKYSFWQVSVTDATNRIVSQVDVRPPNLTAIRQQIETQRAEFENKITNYKTQCEYDDGEPQI
jgi:hypothetical protein